MRAFLDAMEAAAREALENLGALAGSIPTLVAASIVVLLFVLLARAVSGWLTGDGRFSPADPTLRALVRSLVSAAIITFGVAVALGVMGLGIGTLLASFGVIGLVVGFALRDTLENFVSGVLILWRRPFRIADQIRVGAHEGIVRDINFRTTSLQAPDGVEVLIPNTQIFSQPVYNLTRYGSRRTTVVFKLPEGVPIDEARQALRDTAGRIEGVLADQPPQALLLGSGELHLRYWTTPDIERAAVIESAVRQAGEEALAQLTAGRDEAMTE